MQVSDAYLAQVGAGAILDPLTSSGAVARRGVTIMCILYRLLLAESLPGSGFFAF